ncbi:MAG: thioredoxin family protein, partial [Calditrichota bacterium]
MTPFPKERILTGLTYEAFLDRFEKQVQGETPNEITPDRRELLKLNLHRSKRVTRTTKISEELKTLVESITSPQIWLVLTEDWCGDSAQILPQ